MNNTTFSPAKKPIPLRVIFILNALKILLAFGFFTVFTIKDITVGGLDRTYILYTAFGYVLTFAAMVFFILRKNLLALRIVIGIDLLISLPTKALIGIVIAIVSFSLSFHKKVKGYFGAA